MNSVLRSAFSATTSSSRSSATCPKRASSFISATCCMEVSSTRLATCCKTRMRSELPRSRPNRSFSSSMISDSGRSSGSWYPPEAGLVVHQRDLLHGGVLDEARDLLQDQDAVGVAEVKTEPHPGLAA